MLLPKPGIGERSSPFPATRYPEATKVISLHSRMQQPPQPSQAAVSPALNQTLNTARETV